MPSFILISHLVDLITLSPTKAAFVAAMLVGAPELGPELHGICRRESNCQAVGVHDGDQKYAQKMYDNAVRVGWLQPSNCAWHRGAANAFGVRGAFGTSAAYTLWHLGGCLSPDLLDIPIIGAIAAAKRLTYQCRVHGACTPLARHRLWAGARRYDRRAKRKEVGKLK